MGSLTGAILAVAHYAIVSAGGNLATAVALRDGAANHLRLCLSAARESPADAIKAAILRFHGLRPLHYGAGSGA
jgi:hypothetical protein